MEKPNIQDPDKDSMVKYLTEYTNGMAIEGVEDEIEVAIYYFARDYHGGQSSNLYSACSTSDYSPGCSDEHTQDGGANVVADLYKALVYEFADGYFGDSCQNCLQEIPDNDKENEELPTCVICESKGCSHCLSYCKTCNGDVCSNCECNHDNWGA